MSRACRAACLRARRQYVRNAPRRAASRSLYRVYRSPVVVVATAAAVLIQHSPVAAAACRYSSPPPSPRPASHPIAAPRVPRRPLTSQRCRSDVTRHSGSSAFAACGSCSRAFWDRKHCQKKKTLLEIRCSAAAYGGDLVDVPAASLVATRMSSATP